MMQNRTHTCGEPVSYTHLLFHDHASFFQFGKTGLDPFDGLLYVQLCLFAGFHILAGHHAGVDLVLAQEDDVGDVELVGVGDPVSYTHLESKKEKAPKTQSYACLLTVSDGTDTEVLTLVCRDSWSYDTPGQRSPITCYVTDQTQCGAVLESLWDLAAPAA